MTSQEPKISAAEARKLRLAQALRDNMKRRKQQTRGRATQQESQGEQQSGDSNDE